MYFAPGTLYSNSLKPVTATDRVNDYGDTIFYNAGTGHECIVLRGQLYGAEMAKRIHEQMVREAAVEMQLALFRAFRELRSLNVTPSGDQKKGHTAAVIEQAQAALSLANGDIDITGA